MEIARSFLADEPSATHRDGHLRSHEPATTAARIAARRRSTAGESYGRSDALASLVWVKCGDGCAWAKGLVNPYDRTLAGAEGRSLQCQYATFAQSLFYRLVGAREQRGGTSSLHHFRLEAET
jgi:hypothetical protein